MTYLKSLSINACEAPSPIDDMEEDSYSDFSAGEEALALQILEDAGSSGQLPPDISLVDPTTQLDLENAVAAGFFDYTPASEGDEASNNTSKNAVHHHVLSYGQAKTTTTRSEGVAGVCIQRSGSQIRSMPLDGIEYPDLSYAIASMNAEPGTSNARYTAAIASIEDKDERSPLERFRSFPKKPLSVTDISSGAWCELQYWYTLTLLPRGKRTRTDAMRSGTKVHEKLESEVHRVVQVSITRKEEAFALRLWNTIQGLRTLRDYGLTRELEVWGMIDGQVVNGVIDELSFTSPNVTFEEEMGQKERALSSSTGNATAAQNQSPITKYFEPHHRKVYVLDVKTRGSQRLPSGAALRPTRVQLFLYHRILGDMASRRLDFPSIIARYGLKGDATFSDAFMTQIGALHDDVFEEASDTDNLPQGDQPHARALEHTLADLTPSAAPPSESMFSDLIKYQTINKLLPLLETELLKTFPNGDASLGDIVSAQYRHRDDGHIIGNQTFPVDSTLLNSYLDFNLSWWLGRRKEAEGVAIEEAYKCKTCEFAAICDWRIAREKGFLSRKTPARRSRRTSPNSTRQKGNT